MWQGTVWNPQQRLLRRPGYLRAPPGTAKWVPQFDFKRDFFRTTSCVLEIFFEETGDKSFQSCHADFLVEIPNCELPLLVGLRSSMWDLSCPQGAQENTSKAWENGM